LGIWESGGMVSGYGVLFGEASDLNGKRG